MSKIEIPKDIFEQLFFKDGGEKRLHKSLTGAYQFGLDKDRPLTEANAVVEDKEFIQDSQGTRQVEGDKHEEGGEPVVMEDGTKVLSDNLKIGKTLSKEINSNYDVRTRATDTYARALEKIRNSIGLTKVIGEQEKIIADIEKQQKETDNETTLSANIEILSEKLNENESNKLALDAQFDEAFNFLFEKQEDSKPKEGTNSNYFADGGTKPPSNRIANIYEDYKTFKKQREIPSVGSGVFGSEIDKQKAIQENFRLFPTISQRFLADGRMSPTNTKEFQQAIQNYYFDTLSSAERLYGKDSDFYKNLESQINADRFTDADVNTDVRSFDNKFGNFSSTRPNFSFPLLPTEILNQMNEEGVNTIGQLKAKHPDLYQEYVGGLDTNIPDDVWLGDINSQETVLPEMIIEAQRNGTQVSPREEEGNIVRQSLDRTGVFNMPDQTPMTPDPMASHLKVNRRYERLDFSEISPELQLAELNKLTERAEANLSMMTPQQRAGTSANLLSTQADQTNKILAQTEQFNKQGYDRIQNMNAQITNAEVDAGASDALNYEQRQMLAEAKTDAEYKAFYNTLMKNNLNNFNTINSLNLSNALYENFQFTDRGIELRGTPNFRTPNLNK